MADGRVPWLRVFAVAGAIAPAAVAYAAMLGLGLHRHGAPWAISGASTVMVFGPALFAAAATRKERRTLVFAGVLAGWSLAMLLGLPVYFPGERRQAVATGIALVGLGDGWESVARGVADRLPEEPVLAEPEVPEATQLIEAARPAPVPLNDDEIALPYDGQGRRLSVPVAFEHDGVVLETWMMLDTGATYTTLPHHVLEALGVDIDEGAPQITLHTANGMRDARLVLLDHVWLGDLSLGGVAVATCDPCEGTDTVGLLGLNVTGGYNLFIDADRTEVVFTERPERDNHLDVGPFVDLSASFSRFPGGRVEVQVRLDNRSPRAVRSARAAITCEGGEGRWSVDLAHVEPGERATVSRRLPQHGACAGYRISLDGATW